MPKKLSPTQQSLVDHMAKYPSFHLMRFEGGFWTTTNYCSGGPNHLIDWKVVPYWGTTTVRTLIDAGVLVSITPAQLEWKSQFKLGKGIVK